MYRNAKKNPTYVFDKVLNANRNDPHYSDCDDDEEILRKKFAESIYGNGIIDRNIFRVFLKTIYNDLSEEDLEEIIDIYMEKLEATEYKKSLKEILIEYRNEINMCLDCDDLTVENEDLSLLKRTA